MIFTYNRERMLAQCLDSVVPTAADCEILISDDGSTDGTPDLVRRYADRDPRIRYFRQPKNVGFLANLENAEKEARGEYLTSLADDDSVEPGNYERKVAILDAYPEIGLVYSLAWAADENLISRQVIRRAEYLDYSYIGGRDEFTDLMSGNYFPGNAVVFRRSLLEQYGSLDRNLPPAAYPHSDWDLWLRYTRHHETAFINEPLVKARFHGGSMGQASRDLAMGSIAVWRKWLVDSAEPPVLDNRTWEKMYAVFEPEVQRLHGDDPPKLQSCLAAFDDLRHDAAANASLAFARRTRCITTRPELPTKTSVVWTGPVWGLGGIASDVRGLAAAAETVSAISLRLEDLNWGLLTAEPTPGERVHKLSESVGRPLPAGNNHLHVWQGPLEYFRPDLGARASAARVAFADDTPPPTLLEKAGELQALWLPSQFHCDVLVEHGIPREKLRVLPTCVDVGNRAELAQVDLGTGRHFNFASMVRSPSAGLEVLLRAFAREFRPDEDVALVLVVRTTTSKTMEQLVEQMQIVVQHELGVAKEIAPVILRAGPLADNAVAALLGASQAYVEPRPTTWGRGVLEAMAYGVPVIGAHIGPNIELLNPENSFTIPSRTTPETLGPLMRQAYSDFAGSRRRGFRARAEVAAKHSVGAVAVRVAELVDELQSAG
jgi:glycosyltransferase involved in cell wall biosynthesis